jgi:hypothetical protein
VVHRPGLPFGNGLRADEGDYIGGHRRRDLVSSAAVNAFVECDVLWQELLHPQDVAVRDDVVTVAACPQHRRALLGEATVAGVGIDGGEAGDGDDEGDAIGCSAQRLKCDRAALGVPQDADLAPGSERLELFEKEIGCGRYVVTRWAGAARVANAEPFESVAQWKRCLQKEGTPRHWDAGRQTSEIARYSATSVKES